MFRYRKKSKSEVVPGSYGRYSIDIRGKLYDRLHGKFVKPVMVEDTFGYEITLPNLVSPVTARLLVAITHKKCWLPTERLDECTFYHDDGDPMNVVPENLIWVFPEGGIEVPTIPGFYFIPSFTRYAISRNGSIISLFEADQKMISLAESGYKNVGLRRDDLTYVGTNIHRLIGLTFVPYDERINDLVINHKDGDRNNDSPENIEWVTVSENVTHGLALRRGYKGSAKERGVISMLASRGLNVDHQDLYFNGVEVKNIHTGTVTEYGSQLKAARALGVSTGTISLKLNQNAVYPVIDDTYIVRRKGQDWPVWDEECEYTQAKVKPTLVKCVATGEVQEYPSAKAAIAELGLSKKVVTTSLKRRNRRVIDGFVFKYKTDPDPW